MDQVNADKNSGNAVVDRETERSVEEAERRLKCGYCGHTEGCFCNCPTDKPLHQKHIGHRETKCFCGTELEAGLCPNGHDPITLRPRRWCSVHNREEFKYESLEHELAAASSPARQASQTDSE